MQIPVTSACHLRFLIKSGFDHFVSIHNVSVDGTAVHWTSVSTFRQVVNRSKYMYMNEANNYSYLLAEGCWLLVTVLYGCNVKPCGFCHCPLGKLGLTVSIKCRFPLQLPPPPPLDKNKSFFSFWLLSLRTFSTLHFNYIYIFPMCRDMMKLLDNITVTFILTIPYSNSRIYLGGKKKKQLKKKESEIVNPFSWTT